MKHEEGFLNENNDRKIYYQCWLPEGNLKAVLLVVHGLAEHCGRYMNLVNRFVPLGYGIYTFDLPGHGKSYGKRVFINRFEDYTQTLAVFRNKVQALHNEVPLFLVGHSMGSLVSTVFLAKHQEGFAGAVLSGSGAVKVPDNISSATIFAGKVFSVLMPKIGLIGLDVNGVSRDPSVVKAYVDDPLVHTGKTTARLAAEILGAMQRIPEISARITLPILLIQGGADRLVDPEGAQMLFETVLSSDKTIKIYEGLYHEIFNEPERDQVLADMEQWLGNHLK
ncbi:MAG: alpha/beta hydrolase [Deltaproteobacteria bacterium]|nr:alpha/beta hydrolase [Deltaproteobacteria bacterium]